MSRGRREALHRFLRLGKLVPGVQPLIPNLPQHMAHLDAVVIAGELGFPIAPHNLQRVVKPEQELHIVLITGVQQLLVEHPGGGDLGGHGNQLRG